MKYLQKYKNHHTFQDVFSDPCRDRQKHKFVQLHFTLCVNIVSEGDIYGILSHVAFALHFDLEILLRSAETSEGSKGFYK